MVTLQMYCPPSDVLSSENDRVLLSDTTEPEEFSHSTVVGVTRLRGAVRAVKLQSIESGWPASEVMLPLSTVGGVGSDVRGQNQMANTPTLIINHLLLQC